MNYCILDEHNNHEEFSLKLAVTNENSILTKNCVQLNEVLICTADLVWGEGGHFMGAGKLGMMDRLEPPE